MADDPKPDEEEAPNSKENFGELLEDNFKLYKRIMDNPDFARNLPDVLVDRYLKRQGA